MRRGRLRAACEIKPGDMRKDERLAALSAAEFEIQFIESMIPTTAGQWSRR